MLKISSSVTSNIGKNLRVNEDNFYMNGVFLSEENVGANGAVYSDSNNRRIQFYAVFDGIGDDVKSNLNPNFAFSNGQYASQLSANLLSKLQKFLKTKQEYNLDKYVHAFVRNTNKEICNHMRTTNMRTGVSFALLCLERRGTIRAYNMGNSKIYMLRDSRIAQLSQDDTMVENLILSKQISADIARHSPENKILTQHLGMFEHEKEINLHISNRFTLRNGDKFLLCTDALCDYLTESRIYQILSRDISEQEIVNDFITEAMQNGGGNNLTVIVIGVNEVEDTVNKKILLQPDENEVTNFTPLRYKKAFALKPKQIKQLAAIAGGVALIAIIFILLISFLKSGPLKMFFDGEEETTTESLTDMSDVPTTAAITTAPTTYSREDDDTSGFVPPETRGEEDYTEAVTTQSATAAPPVQTTPPATQPPVQPTTPAPTNPPATQPPTPAPTTEAPTNAPATAEPTEEQTTEAETIAETAEPIRDIGDEPEPETVVETAEPIRDIGDEPESETVAETAEPVRDIIDETPIAEEPVTNPPEPTIGAEG